MNLGKHYSKSIINKFDYVPVYLPDTKIRPGAILSFGSDFWGINDPVGSFTVVGNLIGDAMFNFDLTVKDYPSSASYNFVSQNQVTLSSKVNANVPNVTKGTVQFNFAKEGSILLFAVKPTESRIENLIALKNNLLNVVHDFDWDNHYIVTSVYTCDKALVFQSSAKGGELVVDVNVPKIGIQGTELNVEANANFEVKWKDKQAFSVDWANDVVLFMKLKRFTKKEILKNFNKGQQFDDKFTDGKLEAAAPSGIYDLIDVDVTKLRKHMAEEKVKE
ncbi:hypothetical protein [Pedobacter sp.]|uniref:hypothetical protein n=1 Tax=Pedobacter sp. TaxID=1411316 RepID=UPI00396CCCC0